MANTTSCPRCGFTVIGATPNDVKDGMDAHICPDRYRLPSQRIGEAS